MRRIATTNILLSSSTLLATSHVGSSSDVSALTELVSVAFHTALPALIAFTFATALGSEHQFVHVALCNGTSLYVDKLTGLWDSVLYGLLTAIVFTFVRRSLVNLMRRGPKARKTSMKGEKHDGDLSTECHQGEVRKEECKEIIEGGESIVVDNGFLKPLLFPSHTTHRRLYPTAHSFSYSYLLVGIPVTNSSYIYESLLSSHSASNTSKPSWFSVHSTDYLQRGASFDNLSFRAKLDLFLQNEGIDPGIFPNAYLVTAPRFLGWSFNPVSFWYLYTKNRKLGAMILEVNNTFDERRVYLLQADSMKSDEELVEAPSEKETIGKRFVFTWQKDFHVSPFNDREAEETYSISAVDVASTGRVDVTIVLRGQNDKAKVVARIFSDKIASRFVSTQDEFAQRTSSRRHGMNPLSLTSLQRILFLIRYGWIGFMTNPRILREARVLWAKGLRVFYRPEPLQSTISRNESREEIVIEKCFKSVLEALSQDSGVVVEYTAAAGETRGKPLLLGERAGFEATAECLRLNVLTPAFYSELARANDGLLAIFERCCFGPQRGEALAWTSNEEKLREILHRLGFSCSCWAQCETLPLEVSILRGLLALLRTIGQDGWLKCLSSACNPLWQGSRTPKSVLFSQLDEEVHILVSNYNVNHGEELELDKSNGTSQLYSEYIRAVLLILAADRLALGSTGLMKLGLRASRIVAVVLLTSWLWSILLCSFDISSIDNRSLRH